jgi:hypothetical protein
MSLSAHDRDLIRQIERTYSESNRYILEQINIRLREQVRRLINENTCLAECIHRLSIEKGIDEIQHLIVACVTKDITISKQRRQLTQLCNHISNRGALILEQQKRIHELGGHRVKHTIQCDDTDGEDDNHKKSRADVDIEDALASATITDATH